MRHGKGEFIFFILQQKFDESDNKIAIIGEIKLNSVGGAKYSGYWKDNKKHGYGIIIGNMNII